MCIDVYRVNEKYNEREGDILRKQKSMAKGPQIL